MDYWNPPKKRLYDTVECIFCGLALLAMFAALLMIVCISVYLSQEEHTWNIQ